MWRKPNTRHGCSELQAHTHVVDPGLGVSQLRGHSMDMRRRRAEMIILLAIYTVPLRILYCNQWQGVLNQDELVPVPGPPSWAVTDVASCAG